MKRKAPTEEERAERRERERELVKAAVEELRESEGWQKWLSTRSRFHRYSFGNQLLISLQNDEAHRVAGFKKWLELGYCVRKGEKAIKIWAPIPPSKRKVEEVAAARARGEDADTLRTFFRLVPVFGDNQVDPLPPPAEPVPIVPPHVEEEGNELEHAWEPLCDFVGSLGQSVFVDDTGQSGGYLDLRTMHIHVRESSAVNQRVRTLIHEIAHLLVRVDRQDGDPTLDYASEELVAESVAFSVTNTLGLDASGYSIPYLTGWSTKVGIEVVEQTAQLTNRLCSRIEAALPESLVVA